MVALQLGSCAQGCHGYPTRSAIVLPYLSRHLLQAHLLLMSLTMMQSSRAQEHEVGGHAAKDKSELDVNKPHWISSVIVVIN